MLSEAQKDAQSRYDQKVKRYTVKYTLSQEDIEITNLLDATIAQSGLSVNQWLKEVIKKELLQSHE